MTEDFRAVASKEKPKNKNIIQRCIGNILIPCQLFNNYLDGVIKKMRYKKWKSAKSALLKNMLKFLKKSSWRCELSKCLWTPFLDFKNTNLKFLWTKNSLKIRFLWHFLKMSKMVVYLKGDDVADIHLLSRNLRWRLRLDN